MNNLWQTMKLGEIVHEEHEAIGAFDGAGLPVLGVTNIEGVTKTGVEASDDRSKYLRLRPGRFVYNPYRVNVGSIGLSSDDQDGICSPAYVVFAPSERINAKFLLFFLKSARGSRLINFHGNRGSVRSALRFQDLSQIEIPIPSLPEQRRIVAQIERLMTKVEQVRELRRRASEDARAIVDAAMKAYFNFSGAETTVGDYARIQGGYAFPSTGYDESGTHQVVRIGNVRDGFLDLSRAPVRWTLDNDARIRRYELNPGDLLISMTGTRNKRDYGFIAKVPSAEKLLLNQRVGRFAIQREVNRDYLFWFLRSPFFRDSLFPSATGTANQANIGNADVEAVPFAPPKSLLRQGQIVAELDGLRAQVDAVRGLQSETQREIDGLIPSVLDKAFRGELQLTIN